MRGSISAPLLLTAVLGLGRVDVSTQSISRALGRLRVADRPRLRRHGVGLAPAAAADLETRLRREEHILWNSVRHPQTEPARGNFRPAGRVILSLTRAPVLGRVAPRLRPISQRTASHSRTSARVDAVPGQVAEGAAVKFRTGSGDDYRFPFIETVPPRKVVAQVGPAAAPAWAAQEPTARRDC